MRCGEDVFWQLEFAVQDNNSKRGRSVFSGMPSHFLAVCLGIAPRVQCSSLCSSYKRFF